MCGIVGIAGDLTIKDRDLFEDMLDVCQLRGRDSTGAFRVSRTGHEYSYAKRLGPPTYLVDSREYDREIRKTGTSILVGHCRAKTVGDATVANAHPFDIEEHGIIGVHNGTLQNYHRYPEWKQGKVDSQLLFERIGAHGAEQTFEEIEGAYACVWWDANDGTLNFIRNDKRPLWFCYSEDQRRMFWASETWMFGAIFRTEKLWSGTKEGKIYVSLEEDTLYKVKIDSNAAKDKPVFKVMEGKKIEKKPYQPPVRHIYSNTTTHHGAASSSVLTSGKNDNKGGEVANPFLNDELPHHLTVSAKDSTTKPGTTSKNSENSSTPSKSCVVQLPLSTNTETSTKPTGSQLEMALTSSAKTNRKKLSVVSEQKPDDGCDKTDVGKIYRPDYGVDVRHIRAIDTEFITDMRTGREVSEIDFRMETGGRCCHCQYEVSSLWEVAEIFDNGTRFICQPCVTPRADPIAEVIKELA